MFSTRNNKPMEVRSNLEVILGFIVFPIPLGIGILTAIGIHVVAHGHLLTLTEWFFQVVWCGLMGLAVMICLPVVGIAELRTRRRARDGEPHAHTEVRVTPSIEEPPQQTESEAVPESGIVYPRYVHVLTRIYYLSFVLCPVGFFALLGVAGLLFLLRGFLLDGYVVGVLATALACAVGGPVFREWFVRWGRRRYLRVEYDKESPHQDKNTL